MNTFLFFTGTYVLFAIWQSTLWLAVVWIFGRSFNRTPWKTHFLCVTGIFAATLTPLFSTLIDVAKIGVLNVSIPLWIRPEMPGLLHLAGMVLFVTVLLYGIVSSRKLMFHATPFPDRESQETLLRHSKSLRNVSLPILFTSPSVKSPTVWCWGLHPAVLLPESLAESLRDTQRDAVFLHEIAHIIRRDHLTSLLTRLCGAVLFWNPLYWLVLWQSDLAADQSCDLIVLAQGNIPPKQYSDTLLCLVTRESSRPILQFLSRKEKIMKRIEQISTFEQFSSIPSTAWTATVLLAALLLSVTLAFCQEGKTNTADGARMLEISKSDWYGKLDEKQKKYVQWDENHFAYVYNLKNYDVGDDRDEFEKRWVDELDKPEPGHPGTGTLSRYDEAIIGLATITSDKALKPLLKIAAEQVIKDNAHRHFATKALGILGDPAAIPELIPLVYHFNFNTRWEAQVSLVRLTGQNFGSDVKAWGEWYAANQEELGQDLPKFDPTPVDWSCGNSDPQLQYYCSPAGREEIDARFFSTPLREDNEVLRVDIPVVVRMEPANGATNVDAAVVKELRVTFDVDMDTKGYSWCGGGDTFPKTTGNPKWIDKRTCVLPVALESGRNYLLGINAPSFKNFKSQAGVPVDPVTYKFSTK